MSFQVTTQTAIRQDRAASLTNNWIEIAGKKCIQLEVAGMFWVNVEPGGETAEVPCG